MLKGGETPSHDETNPPTSPHQRALAPLSPPSFSMNSLRSFRHFTDDVKVLEELYTNDQIYFNNFLVYFKQCFQWICQAMNWTIFSPWFCSFLEHFFPLHTHSAGPISLSSSSCALHLSQCRTLPSSVALRFFFFNAQAGIPAMMLSWKNNDFYLFGL